MAASSTRPGEDEVASFVDAIGDQVKREDSRALIRIMSEITGEDPKLWGSVIGFGTYQYRYASGREGESAKVGFTDLITRAVEHIDQVEKELGGLPRMSEMPPYRAD